MEIKYLNEIKEDNKICSVDMLRVTYKLNYNYGQKLLDYISMSMLEQYEYYETRKVGSYRFNFSFKLADGCSYWLGIGLNSNPYVADKVCFEYNPNKVGSDAFFQDLLMFCKLNCKRAECNRFDLAIDIPVERKYVFLRRDSRRYECVGHGYSVDTEYLGRRNAVGRVKVYNKQAESKLNWPLTRCEITLDLQVEYNTFVGNIMPVIYIPCDDVYVSTLSSTDLYLIDKILECPSDIVRLARDKRKKIEPIVNCNYDKLCINKNTFDLIIQQVRTYVNEANVGTN